MKIANTVLLLASLSLWVSSGAATPAACADTCEVASHGFGYIAPVSEVNSGASIVWSSIDTFHITADGSLGSPGGSCFFVDHHTTFDSEPVRFDFDGTTLTATSSAGTLACEGAQTVGGTAALLQYYCVLHPNMRAALLVNAA